MDKIARVRRVNESVWPTVPRLKVMSIEEQWIGLHPKGLPAIEPAEHRLMIHGMVDRPLIFTIEELSERLVGYQSEEFYWHYLMKGIVRSSLWVLINLRFIYCQ